MQTIYLDPPYGIKFGSNWQVSTRKRDVRDGKAEDATRQPEQVRAFRDTWKLGIHSYLAYLRDRLVVARDLLTETGSVFVHYAQLVTATLGEGSNPIGDLSAVAARREQYARIGRALEAAVALGDQARTLEPLKETLAASQRRTLDEIGQFFRGQIGFPILVAGGSETG